MNSFEKDIQNRFIDIVTKQDENSVSNAFKVYQRLVYYRYEEIIKNNFIQFCKYISEKELEKTIFEFLKTPCTTAFVWQIAKDYMNFVKKNRLFDDRKYLYELLYFDWIEVELSMKEYKVLQNDDFSWENVYKLSTSARIKRFDFDILNTNVQTKEENFVLIYYDFSDDEVKFRNLNPIIFYLLKSLDKKRTINQALEKICIENELDLNEAKELLTKPFEEINSLNILKLI